MRIRWTPAAADDLEQIWKYLHANHPHFAKNTIRRIYDDIRVLARAPRLGRIGREPGTRELILTGLPYLAVYRVKDEAIEVLHIFHGAQNHP